jgi:iron(III) transport system permease protein
MAGPAATYVKGLTTSLDQVGYSLVLAFLGALVALALGFSLSYVIERSSKRMNVPLSYATFLPLAIPATIVGIGLIKVWNKPLVDIVYGSSWIIVFGYVARFIPFSTITINSGLKQLNPRLEEAAFLATVKWKRVVRNIVLPHLRHSLAIAFFIVFILSFGELGTTLLVIPPGRETLPIKIYNLMHYGAEQMVASLCLVFVLIVLAFSGILFLFIRKLTRLDQ